VASHIAPVFLDGLFDMRPCKRRLRFVGCDCDDQGSCNCNLDQFFVKDHIYESIAFNGATYVIQGWNDECHTVGWAYFERVD